MAAPLSSADAPGLVSGVVTDSHGRAVAGSVVQVTVWPTPAYINAQAATAAVPVKR